MTNEQIWNCDTTVAGLLGIIIPEWIDQNIDASTIASIVEGGCSSGAYMPAVTHHMALRTMSDHGDDVLQYIDDAMGELPAYRNDTSWSVLACLYLSCAVEIWASDIYDRLFDFDGKSYDAAADAHRAADSFRGGAQ
jgi:hypothetical protein